MSGGTLRGEDKKMKKLKSFFDKNASLSKRWKSLLSYSGEFLFILLHLLVLSFGPTLRSDVMCLQ